MATGQPQTIGEQLFTEVAELFTSTEPASPFVLSRIMREADKLQTVDAVGASVVKSALAAYGWQYEEAMRWVNNSIALKRSALNLHNAAVTMRALNDFAKARHFEMLAAECAPNDVGVVRQAVNSLILAGGFTSAYQLALRGRDSSDELDSICTELGAMHEVMEELGVSEERILHEMDIACSVARSKGVRILSAGQYVARDPDGGRGIFIPLSFIGDIEAELELEQEFAMALASDDEWDPLKLSIEFTHD